MEPEELASQLRRPTGEAGIELGNTMNELNFHISNFVYDQLNLEDNHKVLEVGFGNGKLIPSVLDRAKGVSYHGIDLSQDMVNEASQFNKALIDSGVVSVQLAGTSEVPYSDDYFDKICTINTLYFWENPLEEAQELKRTLKAGGSLYVGIRPKENVEDMEFVKFGFTLYSIRDAVSLFESAGYGSVEVFEQTDPEVEFNGKLQSFYSVCIKATK